MAPITVGHMIAVRARLDAVLAKRVFGLNVKQPQCVEETTDELASLREFVQKRIEEA